MSRALVVDHMGVLTNPVGEIMASWMAADRLDPERFGGFIRGLVARSITEESGPVHGLEVGTTSPGEFERALSGELAAAGFGAVAADGLLGRMFGGMRPEPVMLAAVAAARAAGLRTALLSNAFGLDYPRADWPTLFDATVVSDEVGIRKPDPAIYRLVCSRLGVAPSEVVFVDDFEPNVAAAEALGMTGVHHTTPAATVPRLEQLLDIPLTPPHQSR